MPRTPELASHHNIEADADPLGVDVAALDIMLEPGGEEKETAGRRTYQEFGPVPRGVLRSLYVEHYIGGPRVAKDEEAGAFGNRNVVDAGQEAVGMPMRRQPIAAAMQIRPTAGYEEIALSVAKVLESLGNPSDDEFDQRLKVGILVQGVAGLPLAGGWNEGPDALRPT